MDIPQFVPPFTCRWTFGCFQVWTTVNKVAAYTTSSSLEVESAGSGRNLEVSQTVRKGWAVAYAISAQQNPGPGFLQGAEKPPVVAKASSRRGGISSAVWASTPV